VELLGVPAQGSELNVVAVDDPIPAWNVASVSADKMKIFSALIRDPNPIHIDAEAARALGLGQREINQGPISLGYLMNMLGAWCGDVSRVRRVRVRFQSNVEAGDGVVASGKVTALEQGDGEVLAECEVWLDVVGGARAMAGTATVALPPQAAQA
jgi:acyl dehydratase